MSVNRRKTTRQVGVLLIGLVIAGLILPGSLRACSCINTPAPWEARVRADAVFSGTVIDTMKANHRLQVTFHVDNTWEGGDLGDRVVVVTSAGGATCGFLFAGGKQYLVYANAGRSGFFTTSCTRTARLERAQADIEAFESDVFLGPNYPDPFNPVTTILFGLPAQANVSLEVYDPSGQVVETLVDGTLPAGTHRVTFDGSDLPSGLYFYRLKAADFVEMRSMVLVR